MKPTLHLIAIASLALSAAFPAHAAADDEATLKTIEQTWITAASTANRATLDTLLDDTFVTTTPSGARRSKSDVLLAPPTPPGSTQTLMNIEVHVTGDTAVVTGTNHFNPGAHAQPSDYAFTDVFVRRESGWRAVSAQLTRR
ncbi:nuclear transport factor 2 family protein [Paraburkholderia sp.]|uniref:nuclear transport factor 2 family protein n=1 Tax=Paraburkholderia sp. TaxID=1926495 RepID=UPI002382D103|nr:nuclear transport factor 2 family protein [Paraburkholderia sp.]MDE1183304.1 nuclear transport factor 2 family protein [Paraburkholderia sp.]